MLLDIASLKVKGYVKILNAETKEVILDTMNAIHYGNLTFSIVEALIGDNNSFITYMAFGNGGTSINGSTITYKPPNTSNVKDDNAQLYNTTFIRKLSNDATPDVEYDNNNFVIVSDQQSASNYQDIVATVLLEFGDNGPTGQSQTDNGQSGDRFVFDEIALYSGPADALTSNETSDANGADVQNFINDQDTLMLTHVIFNPIQKSQNRSLEVVYTLRIQMSE